MNPETNAVDLTLTLPALDALTAKVAKVHGPDQPHLLDVRTAFMETAEALNSLTASPADKKVSAAALQGLERMRTLTEGFTPPATACRSYRAMLDGLARLDEAASTQLTA